LRLTALSAQRGYIVPQEYEVYHGWVQWLLFNHSIIVYVHLIFLNICELSFNRDFAHC